jgi:uncharacterized protein (DUF697 family)
MTTRLEAEKMARSRVDTWSAGAAGISWIPGSTLALGVADMAVVSDVARYFEVTDWNREALAVSLGASIAGKKIAGIALEAFAMGVPVIGHGIKALVAGALTKAVGEAMISHFRKLSPLPWARIHGIQTEHNVINNFEKGMRIHVDFELFNMTVNSGCCAVFFYQKNGRALKDFDQQFVTTDGCVCASAGFSTICDASRWKDFTFFMPYSQLHMNRGKYQLKYSLVVRGIFNGTSKDLSMYSWQHFTYSS